MTRVTMRGLHRASKEVRASARERGPGRAAVLDAVRRAHARGARLIGCCGGAFTLAEAGVLDERRATAHWQGAEEFRARFPSVRLEPDVLFVNDGDILTSAGSAAALHLGLHVVRRDHGAEVARVVSRRLVFAAHRDGGQRQFVERPVPEVRDEAVGPLLAWAKERLDTPLTVAGLAARAGVSAATPHRRFRAQLDTTPPAWLTAERVAYACRLIERGEVRLDVVGCPWTKSRTSTRLIERGEVRLDVVARRSGLGTAADLRPRLRRETGLSPSGYRRRFGPGSGSVRA